MKCATNTLYDLLPQIGGIKLWGVNGNPGFHPRPGERMADVHFSVCRNPYDRAVSIWASTCLREGDRYGTKAQIKKEGGNPDNFTDFVKSCLMEKWQSTGDRHNPDLFMSQFDWYKSTVLDLLVHIEELKPEIESIVGEIPALSRINESKHKPWYQHMTPEAVDLINEWAPNDFDFGYNKL